MAVGKDGAKSAAVAVGPGDLERDGLPGDKGREGPLRGGGEFLPLLRGVDAVEPDLELGSLGRQKGDRVAVRDPDDLPGDRLGGGREGDERSKQNKREREFRNTERFHRAV